MDVRTTISRLDSVLKGLKGALNFQKPLKKPIRLSKTVDYRSISSMPSNSSCLSLL